MLRIGNDEIESTATEYGVRWDDGYVCVFDDEEETRGARQMTGGDVVARTVYYSAWADPDRPPVVPGREVTFRSPDGPGAA